MILSANAIKDRLIEKTEDITSYRETIFISNFNEERLNPNSYNLKLQDELLIYDEEILDMRKENSYHIINIPTEGILLKAGELYLGRTVERTVTNNLVPMLEGRSSIGRLGIFIHVTAGFGDIGFDGTWTLEITCVKDVIVYPFIEICQIFYHTIDYGKSKLVPEKYQGKYNKQEDIKPSQMYEDIS